MEIWTTLSFHFFYCAGMSSSSRRSAVLSSLTWSLQCASRTTLRPVRPSSTTCCPSSQWRLSLVLSSEVPSFHLTDCPRKKQPLNSMCFRIWKNGISVNNMAKVPQIPSDLRTQKANGALFLDRPLCPFGVRKSNVCVYFVSLSARTWTDSEALSLWSVCGQHPVVHWIGLVVIHQTASRALPPAQLTHGGGSVCPQYQRYPPAVWQLVSAWYRNVSLFLTTVFFTRTFSQTNQSNLSLWCWCGQKSSGLVSSAETPAQVQVSYSCWLSTLYIMGLKVYQDTHNKNVIELFLYVCLEALMMSKATCRSIWHKLRRVISWRNQEKLNFIPYT